MPLGANRPVRNCYGGKDLFRVTLPPFDSNSLGESPGKL
jgi:hypothetical protein